jgi:hypothetical protein
MHAQREREREFQNTQQKLKTIQDIAINKKLFSILLNLKS